MTNSQVPVLRRQFAGCSQLRDLVMEWAHHYNQVRTRLEGQAKVGSKVELEKGHEAPTANAARRALTCWQQCPATNGIASSRNRVVDDQAVHDTSVTHDSLPCTGVRPTLR